MKYISIISSLLINISFCIGLKALVIPNNATMIAISGSGVSDYIDININPASIHKLSSQVSFSNNQWFGDLQGNKISYLWSKNNYKNFISFESLGLDDIELRDEVPSDNPIGYTEAKWMAVDYVNTMPLDLMLPNSNIDLGYKLKFNYSKLHTNRYYGYSLDLGMIKQFDNINIGATIKNIGKENMGSSYETINPRYTLGVSTNIPFSNKNQQYNNWKLYADLVYEDKQMIYKVASKVQFSFIELMLGSSYSDNYQDFSYGLSFHFNDWSIIYGSLNHENPILGSPVCFEISKQF